MIKYSFEWEEHFPHGYGHTSIAYLKRCIGYDEAKSGDLDAAQCVVVQCVKLKRIQKLKSDFPNATLLPVMSKNKLPLALAMLIGLPICYDVTCISSVKRKKLHAMERILHKPLFCGQPFSGISYILIDDVITQGGTISALRNLVLSRGGTVSAVVALAYAIGSHAIAPLVENVKKVFHRFGLAILKILQKYMIADDLYQLTNSQLAYLLRFRCIENINRKILCFLRIRIAYSQAAIS